MQGLTMDLQMLTSVLVGGTILNKFLWDVYKTFIKRRMRKGLLTLNWTFSPHSKSFNKYKLKIMNFYLIFLQSKR
jgi:hypothetical protein